MELLPRNAMHECRLCRRAVSVRSSVTSLYCVKTSNHVLKIYSPSGSYTHFFHTKRYNNIPTGSLTGAKIAILDQSWL